MHITFLNQEIDSIVISLSTIAHALEKIQIMDKEEVSVKIVPHYIVRVYDDGTTKRERITPENLKEVQRM